jgi:hypothetical protein
VCERFVILSRAVVFWQRLGLASRRASWRRSNLAGYVRQSIRAEIAHTASFVFTSVIAVVVFARHSLAEAGVLLMLNFLINAVPITVLRYNRLRISRRQTRAQ